MYNRNDGVVFTNGHLGIQTQSWASLCTSESHLSGNAGGGIVQLVGKATTVPPSTPVTIIDLRIGRRRR